MRTWMLFGGAGLLAAAALWGSCSSEEPEQEEIMLKVTLAASGDAVGHGSDVTLEEGYLFVDSVLLEGCDHHAGRTWSLIPRAHAHGGATPTLLAPSTSFDLVSDAGAATLGHLHPPPGRYCSVLVSVHHDDHGHADPHLEDDRTFRMEGRTTGSPFLLESSDAFEIRVSFPAKELKASAVLSLRVDRSGWLDGIDLETDGEEATLAVLDRIQRSWGASWE